MTLIPEKRVLWRGQVNGSKKAQVRVGYRVRRRWLQRQKSRGAFRSLHGDVALFYEEWWSLGDSNSRTASIACVNAVMPTRTLFPLLVGSRGFQRRRWSH